MPPLDHFKLSVFLKLFFCWCTCLAKLGYRFMNNAGDERMCGFWRCDTKNSCYYPTESGRLPEITEHFCYYPPPTESGRLTEITDLCYYPPPPTESGRLLEITENFCYYPPPPPSHQSVVVPLLDYPLRIRPCISLYKYSCS